MTVDTKLATADRELKDRHRKMWALGDYAGMARDFLLPLGERLVDGAGVAAGDRVLDVGAGTGNAAIAAARRGARVVASDLTPELFADGRARAAEHGVELEWVQADAEALPFADGEFDVVMSCIGAMFAPHHDATARELVRVCRPGGTIAMLNWTPEGVIGELFGTMRPYLPAPPEGASPPPLWGGEDHVRARFGDAVTDLSMSRDVLPVALFDQPVDYRDYFKQRYGPTIVAYRNVAGEPERADQLDADLTALFERANLAADGEPARYVFEYLVLAGRRAG
ncbi:MAG TPA: class I SAM-dependent methyltransferase [Baekduia sp.]|uniref:class I SAM-dependent methyltransferase n=1 Tax=Baekduia sp. TaxID=2600305 RepID=UPI002D0B8786|nr:class I SAM-dependent methyltransferase [Baekduia sp.]HMJ32481.1 class I SAM-dependent methyltransferase [Baekduia sp.]